MAEKDILEKVLLSFADVFADCENAFLYGERRLEAVEMQPAPTESFTMATAFAMAKNGCTISLRMSAFSELKRAQ